MMCVIFATAPGGVKCCLCAYARTPARSERGAQYCGPALAPIRKVGSWEENMKLMTLLGCMTAAAVGYAVLSNVADIKRYIRISTM